MPSLDTPSDPHATVASQNSDIPSQTSPSPKAGRGIRWISSALGLGFLPKAPGTFGTLAGLPLWWLLGDLTPWLYGVALVGVIAAASWVSGMADKELGGHDNQEIVIDEVVGLLCTAFAVPFGVWTGLAAFVLFRLFDIWKPFPIRWLDRHVSGGFGVVIDDVLAGVWACGLLHLGAHFLGGWP